MGQLLALSQIRQKRHENAQMGVLVAHRTVAEKQQSLEGAQDTLKEYQKRLPKLIEELYKDVLGKKVDVSTVQEKLTQEIKLTQQQEEFQQQVNTCETELTQAHTQLEQAKAHLLHCERKNMALDELLKLERKQAYIHSERMLGKVIDELSTHQYIVKSDK